MTTERKSTDALTIVQEKRRYYIVGNSYPFRAKIKDAGGHWDVDKQAWWFGKQDVAERIVSACNNLTTSKFIICPPRQYNDLVRAAGGVWDRNRRTWILPTAAALEKVQQTIEREQIRSVKRRETEARETAKRKELSQQPLEVTLTKTGRERREGEDLFGQRYLGHGKRNTIMHDAPAVGEIVQRKEGPYLIVGACEPYFMSDDAIEDVRPGDRSGWYADYQAIPVRPTANEIVATERKQAEIARQKRREEIVKIVQRAPSAYSADGGIAGLDRLWGQGRAAGSEYLYGDATRLVYVESSYDDGPHYWACIDAALAAEALSLKETTTR